MLLGDPNSSGLLTPRNLVMGLADVNLLQSHRVTTRYADLAVADESKTVKCR